MHLTVVSVYTVRMCFMKLLYLWGYFEEAVALEIFSQKNLLLGIFRNNIFLLLKQHSSIFLDVQFLVSFVMSKWRNSRFNHSQKKIQNLVTCIGSFKRFLNMLCENWCNVHIFLKISVISPSFFLMSVICTSFHIFYEHISIHLLICMAVG